MALGAILRGLKYITLLVATTVLLLAAAIVFGVVPGGVIPVATLEQQLQYDYLVVAPIAAVGVVLALALACHGRVTKINQIGTPNAEDVEDVPVPGDDFDTLVDEAEGFAFRKVNRRRRKEIKERLRGAAVAALVKEGHSKPEARKMVDDGSWTTSKYAASLLGGKASPSPPLTSLVPFGSSTFEKSVNATVEEIYSRTDLPEAEG